MKHRRESKECIHMLANKPTTAALQSAPQSASTELADAVRNWVHFDNLAENLNKQVTNARALRNKHETRVLELLDHGGMQNAVLRVSGATLQRATRYKQNDLSWSMMEEQLHEFYKTVGKPDETQAIMTFMQRNRGGKTVEYLKKTSLNQPTQQSANSPSATHTTR
jgi:hypothetical protein